MSNKSKRSLGEQKLKIEALNKFLHCFLVNLKLIYLLSKELGAQLAPPKTYLDVYNL